MNLEKYLAELELLLNIDEDIFSTINSIKDVKKNFNFSTDSLTDIVLLLDVDGNILYKSENIYEWNLSLISQSDNVFFHQLFHPLCKDKKCHIKTYWKLAKLKVLNNESFEYQYFDKILINSI